MKIKIKKLIPNAVIPKYAHTIGDAGVDLVATSKEKYLAYTEYSIGLAIEIPIGYVGLIFPRSSISNTNQILTNSVGVIDSNYRGEIKFRFKEFSAYSYNVGDRIGQLLIIELPTVEFEEVDSLEKSERGSGGYGSTGN